MFREQFIQVSATLGIIGDVMALSIAGDGTPVRAATFVIAGKKAFLRAPVLVFIHNQIAISGGTVIATVIASVTLFTCSPRQMVIPASFISEAGV